MNSRGKLIVVGVALLSIGLGGGYWLAMHHRMQGQGPSSMSAPGDARAATGPVSQSTPGEKIDSKTGRKVLYWHDPMVPGPKFDQPGKSPFMDMQLVPVYADEAGDAGKIAISPRTEQNLGIRTAQVKEGSMAMAFSTVGGVSIDDRGITAVQSRVNGYVEKLYVRAQYDEVKRGQRLLDVYAPDWLSAEEEYLALKRITQSDAEMLADAAISRRSCRRGARNLISNSRNCSSQPSRVALMHSCCISCRRRSSNEQSRKINCGRGRALEHRSRRRLLARDASSYAGAGAKQHECARRCPSGHRSCLSKYAG